MPDYASVSMTHGRMLASAFHVALGRSGQQHYAADPFRPILVLGPQRSRKTSGICIPALLEWPGPALVVSTADDIVHQTYRARQVLGSVSVFEPSGTAETELTRVGWNPLDFSRNFDYAHDTARIIIDTTSGNTADQNFRDAAIRLLSTHLFAAGANGYTMADVTRWISTQEEFEVRSLLQATGDELAISVVESMWSLEQVLRSSVYAATYPAIRIWEQLDAIAEARRPERFAPERFLDGPNTMYVCCPAGLQPRFGALVAQVAWKTILSANELSRGFASADLDIRGPIEALRASRGRVQPLLVILDDTGSAAAIPAFNDLVSAASKAAIQFISVYTDLSQMASIYGNDAARSIVNNHPTLVVMPGNHDVATSNLIDNLVQADQFDSLRPSTSASDRVRRLPWGSAMCICSNKPSVIVELPSAPAHDGIDGNANLEKGHRARILNEASSTPNYPETKALVDLIELLIDAERMAEAAMWSRELIEVIRESATSVKIGDPTSPLVGAGKKFLACGDSVTAAGIANARIAILEDKPRIAGNAHVDYRSFLRQALMDQAEALGPIDPAGAVAAIRAALRAAAETQSDTDRAATTADLTRLAALARAQEEYLLEVEALRSQIAMLRARGISESSHGKFALALATFTLADALSRAGSNEEALDYADQAVHLFYVEPGEGDAYKLRNYSIALNSLRTKLLHADKRPEAVEVARRNVDFLRKQYEADPSNRAVDFAVALTALVDALRGAHQWRELWRTSLKLSKLRQEAGLTLFGPPRHRRNKAKSED